MVHLVRDELTPREVEIMEELSQFGQSNKAIADNMGLAPSTIKYHLDHAMQKIGAINRTHAVILYLQFKADRRWVEDHGPDELYSKYRMWSNTKQQWVNEDGSEFIFVLRPETDKHAVAALKTYAQSSGYDYPERAIQIMDRLSSIERHNGA